MHRQPSSLNYKTSICQVYKCRRLTTHIATGCTYTLRWCLLHVSRHLSTSSLQGVTRQQLGASPNLTPVTQQEVVGRYTYRAVSLRHLGNCKTAASGGRALIAKLSVGRCTDRQAGERSMGLASYPGQDPCQRLGLSKSCTTRGHEGHTYDPPYGCIRC